jgi:hypothetical protein
MSPDTVFKTIVNLLISFGFVAMYVNAVSQRDVYGNESNSFTAAL